MKTIATVFNIIFIAFTLMVLMTDGFPVVTFYILITLLSILVPILNIIYFVLSRKRTGILDLNHDTSASVENKLIKKDNVSFSIWLAVMIFNLIWFIFLCWSFVDQYPHPKEKGFFSYLLIAMLTPVFSFFTIYYNGLMKAESNT